jgi:type I restriction enzyme S subunit
LSNLATAKLGDIVDVTDFVANGSFESLRLNVTYSQVPEFAVLVRLVDHNRSWAGPFTYVNRGSYDFLKKSSLVAGDVVIANVGANAGTVFRVPELGYPMTLGPNAVLCRPRDLGNFDSNYMYYFLSGETGQSLIDSIIGGSAQPKFNKTGLRQLMLPVPPISQQRAVADVLVALDDKIAANTKLAKSAHELASTLFSEAVRHLPMSDQTFADVAKVSGGGTPSTKVPEFWGGNINWATPTDVTGLAGPYLDATSRLITADGLKACSSELFAPGAILMTSRATIGAFAIAQSAMAVNQGFIVVEPQDVGLRYWLFHEMQSRVDEFIALANGATFLELSRGNFKKFPVRLAHPQVMNSFEKKAESLHLAASLALQGNASLAETRDTLLPQLMSGKLRVRDAEKTVEAVV